MFPEAPRLPDEVLAHISQLPRKVAPVTLVGKQVRLEPFVLERDLLSLFKVSNGQPITLGQRSIEAFDADELIWRYLFSGPFATADEFADYMRPQAEAANGLCLCIFDAATNQQVGILN